MYTHVYIWNMAVESNPSSPLDKNWNCSLVENGLNSDEFSEDDSVVTSESEDDHASIRLHEQLVISDQRIALACDDGCVRIYTVTDSEKLTYTKATTRVSCEVAALSGRILSVAWSPSGDFIHYGSSDGFIRSWNTKLARESFRITVELGGLGSGPDLCLVSAFLEIALAVSSSGTVSTEPFCRLIRISKVTLMLWQQWPAIIECSLLDQMARYLFLKLLLDIVGKEIKAKSVPCHHSTQRTQGKKICKIFVQRGLGLASDSNGVGDMDSMTTHKVPLVVCITRLVAQKGLHLITHAIEHVEKLKLSRSDSSVQYV